MQLLSLKALVPVYKIALHHLQKVRISINNLINNIDLLNLPQHILCICRIYCESANLLGQDYIREKR
jgi:hypothetical protein